MLFKPSIHQHFAKRSLFSASPFGSYTCCCCTLKMLVDCAETYWLKIGVSKGHHFYHVMVVILTKMCHCNHNITLDWEEDSCKQLKAPSDRSRSVHPSIHPSINLSGFFPVNSLILYFYKIRTNLMNYQKRKRRRCVDQSGFET